MSNNPLFVGTPTADGYKTRGGAMMTKSVLTTSTTPVNVFGATNGFAGSVVGVRVTPRDASAGEISVHAGTPTGTRVEVARVTKATDGRITGSAVSVSGAFIVAGSLTAVTSGGEALVEITFTAL